MRIDKLVFLTATDTTVGFVSQAKKRLDEIKERPSHKRYIVALDSLHSLTKRARIHKRHRAFVRRARKSTFVLTQRFSFRIIDHTPHIHLIRRLEWAYTTSANKSGEPFDETFVKKAADVWVLPYAHAIDAPPSHIFRLGKRVMKRLR